MNLIMQQKGASVYLRHFGCSIKEVRQNLYLVLYCTRSLVSSEGGERKSGGASRIALLQKSPASNNGSYATIHRSVQNTPPQWKLPLMLDLLISSNIRSTTAVKI